MIRKLFFPFALFLALIAYSGRVIAQPVSEDSARVQAERFLGYQYAEKGKHLIKSKANHISRIDTLEETPSYYIFKRESPKGFVIVAGDEAMPAIIGYSLENDFDVDNMPEAIQAYLANYDGIVRKLRHNRGAACEGGVISAVVRALEPGTPVKGPYLTTTWNQHAPYNWHTPISILNEDDHTPTGCVPTAVAQIMNYYRWPANSYKRIYEWDNMIDSYNYNAYSYREGLAVAILMRDLGAIMKSVYASGGTSTTSTAPQKIPCYTVTTIKTTSMKSALAKGPVYVSMSGDLAHAVVADGYDSNGLFHLNVGWGGSCDGYYDINDVTIMYGSQETHSTINYACQMMPNKSLSISIPIATGGVSVNKDEAQVGDEITMSVHGVRLYSGKDYTRTLKWKIYHAPTDYSYYTEAEDAYYGNSVSFVDMNDDIPATSSTDGNFEVIIPLGTLERNGDYLIVPTYYDWDNRLFRPLLQYADGFLNESVRFTYTDGKYVFAQASDVVDAIADVELGQVEVEPMYYTGVTSTFYVSLTNHQDRVFSGQITLVLENVQDGEEIQLDFDIAVPASQSMRTALHKTLDFTGRYRIVRVELWRDGIHSYAQTEVSSPEFDILDGETNIPRLAVKRIYQYNPFYAGTYNTALIELENTSASDYYCYTSDNILLYPRNDVYLGVFSPFRVSAGEKGLIYLSFYKQVIGHYDGSFSTCPHGAITTFPVEGSLAFDFLEKPENFYSPTSVTHFYKDDLSVSPSPTIKSQGTFQRSLWQEDDFITSFPTLEATTSYNSTKVMPKSTELQNIPAGNYLLKVDHTTADGVTWPTHIYPLIIDEHRLELSIERVVADEEVNFDYTTSLPFHITIRNDEAESVTTPICVRLYKEYNSRYALDNTIYQTVTLPAQQTTIIPVSVNLTQEKYQSEGNIRLTVALCQTARRSGPLDFGLQLRSDIIMLPHEAPLKIGSLETGKHTLNDSYYTIDGCRLFAPHKGLNLIRHADGTVDKVIVK